ncbi:hypothetical protein DAY19_14020 [Halobacteriovorax vibrionivorans]|uniref:Transposase IS200-like domain-containing protein n=1 Tax=Halobacteriovorax vibrionivorans TaxID=2152716 RepID=A0ABY0IDQ4_9BACT|nr:MULTISPECIES: transposase [Halobacteriovorax]RZF21092.1 hypothetical protein DAY19_14020 [Halobacteriovorax vibrionivorans]TGD47022.1 hypothetical protein EP118_09635 [Halobacteriovorax sp. Y22]
MPRKSLIRTNTCPYHVTIRTNNKEWFDIPMPIVWSFCMKSINYANLHHPVEIQSFVLMSNHYHLMIWTPNSDLDKFMFFFNSHLSKLIRKYTGRINRIFGDRYKWSLIKDQKYYLNVLRYIYQNPLRKDLSSLCEEYEFSSLYHYINNQNLGFKLKDPIYGDKTSFLKWVNLEDKKATDQTRQSLQKPVYKPIVNQSSRRIL